MLGPGAEFDRIRRFLAELPPPNPEHVLLGPGDDCAVVRGGPIAISTDMSVEGIHFRRDWLEPEQIGTRAVIAALSDLAAVAATPFGVLVSLAVPAEPAELSFALMSGARQAAADAGADLLGGDLTRSPGPIVLDVTVLGTVARPVTRTGARIGHTVWVTGTLGGAECAVTDLLDGRTPAPDALRAFTLPVPRHAEARWLAGQDVLSAMIDLSDGLAGDAGHLAAASGVRIIIDATLLPVHPAARARADGGLALALGGGDDYELCFTAPAGVIEDVRDGFEAAFGVPLTRVGEVVEGSGVVLRDVDGRLRGMPIAGFSHFTRDAS